MRNHRRKRCEQSAGCHTPRTVSGSSLSEMVWLMLRKGIKYVYAIYCFFVNNSDLFIACKLYTVNVAQRYYFAANREKGREEKKKETEISGEREEERHRESEEAVRFCNPPCTSCTDSKRHVVCKRGDTEEERHTGTALGALSLSVFPDMEETSAVISE